MTKKRFRLIAIVGLASLCVAAIWRLYPRLPFTGPHRGIVTDTITGQPIAGATVQAAWWCHDNPLPDGPGHYYVYARATTDAGGAFALSPPSRRGGFFGTNFSLSVTAPGYIDAAFIVDPNSTPLPPSTAAWPLVNTTVHTSLPPTMAIALQPARLVLLKAAQSSDKLIRETAEEMLRKLPTSP